MCNDSFSKVLAFIGALVAGIVAVLLMRGGYLVTEGLVLYASMGLSVLILIITVALLLCAEKGWRCICRYASTLFYAAILAVMAEIAALAIPVGTTLAQVMLGIWSTLAMFAIILFCLFISCCIRTRCGCSAAESRSGCPSSCRYG